MVTSGECTLAQMALEWAVTGVFSVVTSEFVRPGKFPPTSLPVTTVGFLPGVGAEMRLQMRTFRVGLGATRVRATVAGLSLTAPRAPPSFLWLRGGVNGVMGKAVEEVH